MKRLLVGGFVNFPGERSRYQAAVSIRAVFDDSMEAEVSSGGLTSSGSRGGSE